MHGVYRKRWMHGVYKRSRRHARPGRIGCTRWKEKFGSADLQRKEKKGKKEKEKKGGGRKEEKLQQRLKVRSAAITRYVKETE